MDLNMEVLISRSPRMGESDSVAEDARTEFPVLTNSLNKIDFQWSFNDVVLSAMGTTKQSNTNTTSMK